MLQRLHQQGVNWGAGAANLGSSLVPPYWLKLEINQAYNRFLSLVKDYPACIPPLVVLTESVANSNALPLNPIPGPISVLGTERGVPFTTEGGQYIGIQNLPGMVALNVYEFAYIQSSGIMRYIPFVSTDTFRRYTAGYAQIPGAYSAYPDIVCQQFARRSISMFPGTAVGFEAIQLTVCPDPMRTDALAPPSGTMPAAAGGILFLDTDVPLVVEQFHQALVEGAVFSMARTLDKPTIAAQAKELWDALVQEAIDYGSTWAEGDAEQKVIDTWQPMCEVL